MIKENISILKRNYNLIEEDRKMLTPFYIINFINSIITLTIPVIISKIIDLSTIALYNKALLLCALLAIIYILNNLLSTIDSVIYSKFLKYNYVTLHRKIINEIYNFDEDYKEYISKGRIISNTNMDLINISEMADYFFNILINIIKILIIISLFIKINIIITLFVIVIDTIYIYLSNSANKKTAYYFEKQIKQNDRLTGLMSETLSGLKDIKTSNISKNLNKKYDIIRKKWQKAYINKRKYTIIQNIILKNIINLGRVIMYISSIYLVLNKKETIGTILLLISYYNSFFESSIKIMEDQNTIKSENVSLERVYYILEYNKKHNKKMILKKQDTILIKNQPAKIKFDNITFSYTNKNFIKNVSFEIDTNKITAIVGKTGSGKTTIFNLLLGLYNVKTGNIYIENKSINSIDKEEYLKKFQY